MPFYGRAQDESFDSLMQYYMSSDSLLLDELEAQLAADSLTIFDLIDSLDKLTFKYSQLSLRLGYTSNITNAGRNFGIQQYGFTAGVSFYHSSGLFADLSGYWNSYITPHYSPTIPAIGYMGFINSKWTYTVSYDHFFYHQGKIAEDEIPIAYPLTNAANISSYYDIGHFSLGLDYSFLFGDERAHRIRGNLLYMLTKKNWGFIDRFVFMPGASILYGDQNVYQLYQNYQYNYQESLAILGKKLGRQNLRWLYDNNRTVFNKLVEEFQIRHMTIEEEKKNVFGLMNYSFSAPFYFYVDRFSLLVYYNLNVPVALPGEEIDLSPNSYFGCTLMYDIPFFK